MYTCTHPYTQTYIYTYACNGWLMLWRYVMATRTHTHTCTHTQNTHKEHTQNTHTNMVQDPAFVKKHNMTLDLEYYLNNQLKNSVISLLEPIYPRSEV